MNEKKGAPRQRIRPVRSREHDSIAGAIDQQRPVSLEEIHQWAPTPEQIEEERQHNLGLATACALYNAGKPETLARLLANWPEYAKLAGLEEPQDEVVLYACADLVFWHSALNAAGLDVYARAVLCELSKRANGKEDGAFPSIRKIARTCGISLTMAVRSVKELETAGLIRVKRTFGKTSRYTIRTFEEWQEWKARKGKNAMSDTVPPQTPVSNMERSIEDQTVPPHGTDRSTTWNTPFHSVESKVIPVKSSHKEREESADAHTHSFFSNTDPKPKKRKFDQQPSLSELIDYCAKLKLPESDALDLNDRWLGNGFRNDGKRIEDWQATVRNWKRRGYLLSQKQNPKPTRAKPSL